MSNTDVPYRERLLREFGEKEYKGLTKSFDVLGNIAIIDAKGITARKMAKIIMDTHRNVRTVLRKGGAVAGRYRVRKYVFVAGKRECIARYRENGCSFLFDIRKVFFSPRLAYERNRIASNSSGRERVIVMFAGVGPFAIEIAKRNPSTEVIAIEANRDAYDYMVKNIRLNKTPNVTPVFGDVDKTSSRYKGFAERIVMPLPGESHKYLDAALAMAGRSCTIHYYVFAEDDGDTEIKRLKKWVRSRGFRFRLVGRRVARPYSPLISEIVIDFRVRKQ